MGEIIFKEDSITLSYEDFLNIVKEISTQHIVSQKLTDSISKPQLTYGESCKLFGQQRVKDWIKAGKLKKASQNGRGSKVYYDTSKMLKLSSVSNHGLKALVERKKINEDL